VNENGGTAQTHAGEISLEGRVALVTGAGAGLGRAYALALARRGAHVVVNDISGEAAAAVAADITARGREARVDTHSVADVSGAPAAVETALAEFGQIDVVVANAGTTHFTLVDDTDLGIFAAQHAVHAQGAFLVAQTAYRKMSARGYGRLVFVSSATGLLGRKAGVAYAAAKAAVIGLMNVFALEGSTHGVLSNAVLPVARTGIIDGAAGSRELAGGPGVSLDNPRLDPTFVAPLVVYLASEACQSTHGIYSAVAGRFTRVGVAVGRGWRCADGATAPSVDDIAAHWAEIDRITEPLYPASVADEVREATESRTASEAPTTPA
jgi:NAD(P)-dependent dehydrogenase (short-subunit alcohol dehydrogenase family)